MVDPARFDVASQQLKQLKRVADQLERIAAVLEKQPRDRFLVLPVVGEMSPNQQRDLVTMLEEFVGRK